MAISIFETQDLDALVALKQFLQNLPGPKAIETVLAQAVCSCAESRAVTFDWLLDHAERLEPELDLVQWGQRLVATRLELQDFGKGCELTLERQSGVQPLVLGLDLRSRQRLAQRTSRGEWLLIERLRVRS